MKKLLIISYDAVNDSEFERLIQYPAFAALVRQSAVIRKADTVFLSNTYPVHTSVATGVLPCVHGIISNTEAFPVKHPLWNFNESGILVKTIWQAAAEMGLKTASVLWPVTAFSKTIRYNIPEILARPGKSQILTSLSAGSKLLQIKMLLRHIKLFSGTSQPVLDNFASACMADILRQYAPELALVHLTAYDSLCHKYGKNSKKLEIAFQALDNNLKLMLDAARDYDIILFSDHGQLNVRKTIYPNDLLVSMNLMRRKKNEFIMGKSECFIECCGGSAFFHCGKLKLKQIDLVKKYVSQSEGFNRFLTSEEMRECGHNHNYEAFGFCAKEGYCYGNFKFKEAANHGYPLDMPGYKVFYMVRSNGYIAGSRKEGGSLLDIAPLASKILNLDMD